VRVLLDECVPRQLRNDLTGLEVETVQDRGWAGVKNGALIELAAPHFDAIFTVDREFGASYTAPLPLGVVILQVGATDFAVIRPHMPAVLDALRGLKRGDLRRVRG